MKRTLSILLIAVLLLSLCACGSSVEKTNDGASGEASTSAASEKPYVPVGAVLPTSAPVGFKSVRARIAGGQVTILSAEFFVDANGRDAVRFYYEFTNNGKDSVSADAVLSMTAEQKGLELENAFASMKDNVSECDNASRRIEPGITIRCVAEYSFRTDGGELHFTISDADGKSLTAAFDPQSLPGYPGEWKPAAVVNPGFYHRFDAKCSTDAGDVAITGAGLEASDPMYSSHDVLRVYIDYTNRKENPSYFESDFSITAYQDGIEIDIGHPAVQSDSYGNGYVDIAPGDTIMVTRCWDLRSDSPVEVVVSEWPSGNVICADTFPAAHNP